MRRLRLVLAAVWLPALFANPAMAQDPKVGIEAGASGTYLTVQPQHGDSHSMGLGLMAAAFAVVPVKATVSIQPEVQFSRRSSSVTFGTGTARKTVKATFDYASVAVLARLKFYRSMYITEGPAFHFPVRAIWNDQSIMDVMHTDVSLVIGVGGTVRGLHIEGRWDSSIRFVQREWLPGQPFSRHRAISGLVIFPIK